VKYIIVVGDGMADYPLEELRGKTPLQVANKPNMDWIASHGRSGLLKTIPNGMNPGSDIAMMSILGYDPRKYCRGRGSLEAAGMGVELEKEDIAFRCNLITEESGAIADYSGGHITTEEAQELMSAVRKNYGHLGDFHVGISYRHLFVMRNAPRGSDKLKTVPPHEIIGKKVSDNLIKPKNNEVAKTLNEMILKSKQILSNHPTNIARVKNGKKPANMIWVWGQGKKPKMKTIVEKYGIKGAIISAVNVVKGIGVCAGMSKLEVPGATGYYDTNYENKAKFALRALKDHDLVLVHVEAPDEAGHMGDTGRKIEAIENIDSRLLGKIIDGLKGEYAISVTADHATPIKVRAHTSDPVPFAIYSMKDKKDGVEYFDESSAKRGSFGILEGHKLMDKFLQL
jgi:2,3-bisphosphoglycerate-independent phosphoglycerate mutase